MKNTIVLALVCIGLGFAAGWIAKPATETAAVPDSGSSPSAPSNPRTEGISNRSESLPTESDRSKTTLNSFIIGGDDIPDHSDPEAREAAERAKNRFAGRFEKQQQAKLDARIAKLVAELGLTSDQEAQLRTALEGKLEGIGGLLAGGGDPSKLGEFSKILSGKSVDEALAGILTPGQEAAHEALQKREFENKVEARALKSLASLSYLDLTQEQKDAAYDILYADAEKTVDNASPESNMMSAVTEGMGIDFNVEELGVGGAVISATTVQGSTDQLSPVETMAKIKEGMAKRVDEKVEALRPVLTESQLEQYRAKLESGGMLGGFLDGFGDGGEE